MAIQSIDNLIGSLATSKEYTYPWNKVFPSITTAAGRWYDMAGFAGSPTYTSWSGAALACQSVNDTTGFGIPHGGNVSPSVKHVLNQSGMSTSTNVVPAFIVLQDIQAYWPGINMNSNATQNLTGTPTLRYANGEGCRLYLVVTSTTGAVAHNVNLSYTDQSGNTGNTLPVTVACTTSAVITHLTHSGTNTNNYGPYLPLATGDTGVQNVASVTLSAASGSASTASLVLARPLATLPMTTANVASVIDYLNLLPSLPVVKDGACLSMLISPYSNASAGAIMGFSSFVWG